VAFNALTWSPGIAEIDVQQRLTGKFSTHDRWMIRCSPSRWASRCSRSKLPYDTAMRECRRPVLIAAATVPEYKHVLAHVRAVVHAGNDPVGAIRHERAERERTQSVVCRRPGMRRQIAGAPAAAGCSVSECDVPLCSRSGRRSHLPDGGADVASSAMPGRQHASSFETRMRKPLSLGVVRAPATIDRRAAANARAMRHVSPQTRK